MFSFSKKRRRQPPQQKHLSPPASPASFYSPGSNHLQQDPHPPPLPVEVSPSAAFPYATRFPWSPGSSRSEATSRSGEGSVGMQHVLGTSASSKSTVLSSPTSKPSAPLSSPEIQLDLEFTREPLFGDFPSMFDKRGSTPRPSSSKTALPPLKIPTPSPSPKPSPPSSKFKPTHIPAPGSVTPHAPSPASHSSNSSYSGSSTSSSFYSDSFSYIYSPSFTHNFSSPRPRSASPHRLTRQDSATLPSDADPFSMLRRKSSDAAMRNKSSDLALRRKSSVSGKSIDKRRSHSRHSRRASRKSVGSAGAGGGLTPLEPMPKDALERVSGISSVPGSARVSAAGPNSAGPSPATGRSGTSSNSGMSPGTGKRASSPGTGKSVGSGSGAPNGIGARSANIVREGSRSRSHSRSRSRSRSRNRKSHRAPPPEMPSSPVPSILPLSPTGSAFSPTNTNAFPPINVNANGPDPAARGNGFGQFGQFSSKTTRSPANEFPLSPTMGSPTYVLSPKESQPFAQHHRARRVSRISEGSSAGTGSPAKRKHSADDSSQDTRLERHAYGEYDDGGEDGSDGMLLIGDVLNDYLGPGSGIGEYMTASAGYEHGFASPSPPRLRKKDVSPDSLSADETLPYLNNDYDISPSKSPSSSALQRDLLAPRPSPRDPSPRLLRDLSRGAPPHESETVPDVSPKQSEGDLSPRTPARVLPPRTVSKQGIPRPLPPSPPIPVEQLDARDHTRQMMSPEPRPLPPNPPQETSEKDSPPLRSDVHRSPPSRPPPSPPVNAHTSGSASQLYRPPVHAGMQLSEVSSFRDTYGPNLPVSAGPSFETLSPAAHPLPYTPGSRPTPASGTSSFRLPPGMPGSRRTPSPGAPNTPHSRPSPPPRTNPSSAGGPLTPMSRPTPVTSASTFSRGALSPNPTFSPVPHPTLSPGVPVTPMSGPSPARSIPNTPALRPTPSPMRSPASHPTPSPNPTSIGKLSPTPMPPSRRTPSPDPGRPSPYPTGTGSNAVRTPSPSRSAQRQGKQAAQHLNQHPSQPQSQNQSQYQHPPLSQSQPQQHPQPSQPHLQSQSYSQEQVQHSHPSAQSHNSQRRSASAPDTRTPDAETDSMRSASSSTKSSVKAKGKGRLDDVPEGEVRNGDLRFQGTHLLRNHSAGDVSETSSGSHGAGVRRISFSTVAPAPSSRRQSARVLPIGKGPPAFDRLRQRERSGSDSALTSPVHDARRPRASQFPETPHDFSPFLTPSSNAALSRAPSNTQAPAGYDVAVPPRSNMPKPPLIDPAPPRRPRPLGPRRPSVRVAPSRLSHSTTAQPSSPRFEAEPVRWRGLTMDAATWTFTSGQLQDVVGRAIRQSAEPSSIRLLTLDVIDNELQPEVTRLEALREELKTQYRQAVRKRRAALREGGVRLELELMELAETCDRISEELVRVMDELQQINRLRDVHSASALAMALRKLNSSFMKQSVDVGELRTRCAQLEAERDEAWATAERVERDLLDMQAKMDTALGAAALSTPSASNRSSRVSAARTTSVRASRASLRFSRVAARNSHSSTTSSNHLSSAPPVPPMPRLTYSQTLSLNTDLPSASLGTPYSIGMSSGLGHSPSSETRELVQVQNELYTMLGLTRADLRRTRSGRQPGPRRPASEVMSPSSMPTSPFLANSGLITRPTSDVASPQVLARRRNASFSHPRSDVVYFGSPEEPSRT